MEKMLMVIKLD